MLLTALVNGTKITEFQPQNNKQTYLAYLCGADIALPEPRTNEEVLLYKLCVEGVGATQTAVSGLDFSNCSLNSEVAVEVFKSLRDVTAEGGNHNQIILTGNPCITGKAVFKSGRKTVESFSEVFMIFDDFPPSEEISIGVNDGGLVTYRTLNDAMEDLMGAPYPAVISWPDTTYWTAKLTDEDRAIATNKGWTLVEG